MKKSLQYLKNIFKFFDVSFHMLYKRSDDMEFTLKKFSKDITLVIDVGVANGTPDLYKAFKSHRKILIEPIKEFVENLKLNKSILNSTIINGCASESRKKIDFFIRSKKSTSSNNMGVSFDKKIVVQSDKLDNICKNLVHTNDVICLKIDTEGSEVNVLKGSENILKKTKLVVAEATLYPTLKGSCDFFELIDYMKKNNFQILDFVNIRKTDLKLDQMDIIFIKYEQILN